MKKRDYYEILDITVKATPDEIKQAYRKQAIKWHPDKNPSEEAKERFQEIGEAYAVLSDPNERTWYDHHKDQILRTGDSGINENDEKYEDILTYGLDIWQYFDRHCFKGFEDSEEDFYSVYRRVFEILKAEEEKAKHSNPDLDDQEYYESIGGKAAPGFGDSKTSIERVIEFYNYWENFSSYKTFAWKDLYNPNEAGNRQIKRLIEKDNKKERQKEKKKYLDTIKELAHYMKKRDPRYQDYIKNEALEKQKKAEEKRKVEEEKKKDLEERKRKHREEEAERYRVEYEQRKKAGLEDEEEHVENVYHEDWFCEICDKEFKTENQLDNHKQSKAHVKKLKELMEEMMLDEEKVAYENEMQEIEAKKREEPTSSKSKKKKKKNKKKNQKDDDEEEEEEENEPKKEQEKTTKKTDKKEKESKNKKKEKKEEKEEEEEEPEEEEEEEDLDFGQFLQKKPQTSKKAAKKEASEKAEVAEPKEEEVSDKDKEAVNQEKEKIADEEEKKEEETQDDNDKDDEEENEASVGGKKLGKAKLKRLKKQEKAKQQSMVCNVCKESFETRSKLFQHLKESKHELKVV